MRVWIVIVAVVAASGTAAADDTSLVGWWRSPDVCFELFANGDFHLTLKSRQPEQQILGAATQSGDTVKLAVKRIWSARFTGPCRKVHELGHWVKSATALGADFTPGATTAVSIKRRDATHIELCATTCATLARDTPVLVGRWRSKAADNPTRPATPWTAGQILELALDGDSSHLWIATAGDAFDRNEAAATATYVGPDRFTVEVNHHALAVKRLADERVEVCEGKRCATLDRELDAYSHDVR